METGTNRYVNREISWLSFNERVLQEAADPTTPLIERIKFLGIFSSNLDEFFRVRVATVTRMVKARKKVKAILGEDPKEILNQIQKVVLRQQKKFDAIYADIVKMLEKKRIFIINEKKLDAEQQEFVRSYFNTEVRPLLFPVMIDNLSRFPVLKDHSIYLAVRLSKRGDKSSVKHALIEVPTDNISRFLVLPRKNGNTYIMLLDDVIRFGLKDIFSMFECTDLDAYTIKFTRDAELDIDDDITLSFFEKMSKSLQQRKKGAPVRFIYDDRIPKEFLRILAKKTKLTSTDTLIPGGRYHNFKDFMSFPSVGPSSLRYKPLPPLPHPDIKPNSSIFAAIRKNDILLHYPYHSFQYMIELLREASIDPNVSSIKITLYRLAERSKVVNSLINAARNGKEVMVVIELQARFDEEANIYWTTQLKEEEGIKVVHGVPGLKVHCKLCLITRREKGKYVQYACIGTGNFNESTAKIYGDHALFTADERLTPEVARVFDFFDRNYMTSRYAHLLVSPFYLMKKLRKLVKNEIDNAKRGKEAYMILKMNSLVDRNMIDLLYDASREGVKIDLIVRGICSLVPGVRGMSENITAVSIIDRFLEHSRIFVFCNGGDEKYYISSADWMPRNLDRRVEVVAPVYDKRLKKELRDYLEIQLNDNVKARMINERQDNKYRERRPGEKTVRAQMEFHEYLKKKTG